MLFRIKIGDKIRITRMKDNPLEEGKCGEVRFIDAMGKLYGTWGESAVVPDWDWFDIIDG